MKRRILISTSLLLLVVLVFGQNDSILFSNFKKLNIKPSKFNIVLYSEALQWGLVGRTDQFVTDETEILVEEWLEYIYYHDYKRIRAYTEEHVVNEKNTSSDEKEKLLNAEIDTTLLPTKEFLDNYNQSYVFTKCRTCSLMSVEGLHGRVLIPVETDSLCNEEARKRLFYFLETPISGISYEQAVDFCIWRTQTDSVKIQLELDFHSSELPKSKLSSEYTYMRCFRYYLPTPEQFDAMNPNLDSLSRKRTFYSSFNYKNSRYSKRQRYSETNLRCGHLPVNGFEFSHPTNWPKGYWVKNAQGNVAEMTSVKGIARGGSYFHPAKDSYKGVDIKYDKPELWLGFRCVGIKYQVFEY